MYESTKTAISLGHKDVEMQGQWRIEDGHQCMRWTEIADDGGLLPQALGAAGHPAGRAA